MRSTFELEQSIAIVAGAAYFDLHNCYDFIGYEYRPTERTVRFEWERTIGPWVRDDAPAGLSLLFEDVTNFAVKKRDDEMPFTEDDCVSSISFLPHELGDEFDAVCPDHRSDDEHVLICFQSGASVKIWAEKVTHEIKTGA